MKKLFWRAALFFSIFWQTNLPAQICVPADNFPGPYICWPYITNISGNTAGSTPDVAPGSFCTTVENNSWFSFSPCLRKVSFTLVSANCKNGSGLEAAIFDRDLNLVSNCYSSGGVDLGGIITAENLVPGQVYYFMIDGFRGDDCEYILTGTEGLNPPGTPVINSQTGYITGASEICQNSIATYTAVPPMCNILGNGISCPLPDLSAYYDTLFHWTIPPGAVIISDSMSEEIVINWGSNTQPGRLGVQLEIIPLNGSCDECAGGLPGFACSSEILPLFINIKPPYYNNLPDVNLCEGECFDVAGYPYCDAGHYEVTLTSSEGCDSIIVFDVFVNKNIVNRLPEKYICEGDCISEAGQVFCNEGEYEIHLNTAAGCDSLVVFEIILLDEPIEQLPPMSFCEDNCFEIAGREFCESGTYQVDLQTKDGCDSIVVFEIEILKKSENILDPVEICEGDCYYFGGQEICEPGIFEFYRINSIGCDSLIVLEVIQNKTDKVALPRITLCEGQIYQNGGQTFDRSGVNQVVLQNQFGCDSTVMFDLDFRAIEVEFPSSIILSPSQPNYQIMPDLKGTNRTNLRYDWQGFPGSFNALNQYIDTSGIYTLTVTDTVLGCSMTKAIEVFELNRECQTGLFISTASSCETAPFICGEFLDGFCAKTDGFTGFPVRGNIRDVVTDSIENPEWMRWSPCAETAVFRLGVKESRDNKGIAFSVLKTDDCETYQPLINSEMIEATSVETITVNGLVPGEVYRFLFDGIDADICEFQIEIIEGVSMEPVTWELVTPAQIIGDLNFCPGVMQELTLVPPVCRVVNGNCAFAGELMIMKPQKIKWNLPSQAKVVDDLTSDKIEVTFEEDALLPRGARYLPDGLVLSENISVEITGTMQLPDAVICTNEDSCTFTQSVQIEVNHELEVLPTVDICENSGYQFCSEVVTESELKVCREDCKTTVQQVNVRTPRRVDYGFVRICPGTCYTMPISKKEICESGIYTFPIADKCGGTETVALAFYDREPITIGPVTEICHPLHTSYRVSFDISEGVPPYFVDGESVAFGRFTSDSIPNGSSYVFELSDASICQEKSYIDGRYDCGPFCSSEAGTMSQLELRICSDEVAKTDFNQNAILDPDDGLEFILHTSPIDELGQIIDRRTSSSFVFMASSMDYNRTYYASSVAGTLANGQVDLDDPCLSVSPGQPVVFQRTPAVDLQDDIVLDCKKPTAILSAGVLPGDDKFGWTLPNGTASAEAEVLAIEPGEYIFNAVADNGCSIVKTITVSENKTLPDAEAGDEKTLRCAQQFVELDAFGSSVGTEFNYKWSTDTGQILGDLNSLSAKATKPGVYSFLVENTENGCRKTDSVFVSKSDKPEHTAEINIEMPSCFGLSDGAIGIENITGGNSPYEISFDGTDFSKIKYFQYLQSGSYELKIRDNSGCVLRQNIKIEEPFEVAVDLGDDQFITLGDRVTLTAATTILPAQIEWWGGLENIIGDQLELEVRPTQTSTYFVKVSDENGCFEEDEINIIVKDADVYIPSGFSPNGDKNNDFFTVFSGESVRNIVSLRVYDRRGGLIFENKNFPSNIEEEGWGGYFKGKRVRPDVFVYVIDIEFINGDIKTFRGDVTLVR